MGGAGHDTGHQLLQPGRSVALQATNLNGPGHCQDNLKKRIVYFLRIFSSIDLKCTGTAKTGGVFTYLPWVPYCILIQYRTFMYGTLYKVPYRTQLSKMFRLPFAFIENQIKKHCNLFFINLIGNLAQISPDSELTTRLSSSESPKRLAVILLEVPGCGLGGVISAFPKPVINLNRVEFATFTA